MNYPSLDSEFISKLSQFKALSQIENGVDHNVWYYLFEMHFKPNLRTSLRIPIDRHLLEIS